MSDLLIRNGTIVDGTGAPPVRGDVAIEGDRIVAVGSDLPDTGSPVFDATGLLVTPGWVDIHTHYDGQATWDDLLAPSALHGVTTVVMGNCGVGFAPVRPTRRDWLIGLMEGVEDIPGTALCRGDRLAVGVVPRVSRRPRPTQVDYRRRCPDRPRGSADIRHG